MSPSRQARATPVGVRPGRPDKRQAIIDAARQVFLRHGFTDTSLDVVAAEAGVSKQTIYNHFGDKTSLFIAVIDAAQAAVALESQARFAEQFQESGDLETDLRAVTRLWTESVLSEDVAGLRRVIIAEQWRHPDLAQEWSRPRSAFEESLAQELEKYVSDGVLDIVDVHVAAHQLVLLTVHEAMHVSQFGLRRLSPAQVDKIAADGVDMWLRSYRARA